VVSVVRCVLDVVVETVWSQGPGFADHRIPGSEQGLPLPQIPDEWLMVRESVQG
jgi:hypothetical protein